MYKYDKFFEYLKEHNLTEAELHKTYGIPRSLLQRMHQNKNMRTSTLNKLCNTLKCTPSDVVEFIHDGDGYPKK